MTHQSLRNETLSQMPNFHPDFPQTPQCPPAEATAASGMVWRAVFKMPLCDEAFKSYAELGKPNCDRADCNAWGLSVWTSEAAVLHARKLMRHFRKRHIAAGTLDQNDGVLLPTPSSQQPDHHTFWKFHGHSVLAKFQVVMEPST
jgi:hypothetical protein